MTVRERADDLLGLSPSFISSGSSVACLAESKIGLGTAHDKIPLLS